MKTRKRGRAHGSNRSDGHGVGIAREQLEFIFDEFHQVEIPGNGAHQRCGLGLNIVQRMANLLRLELGVRSQAGKGSVFSIVLPAAEGDDSS